MKTRLETAGIQYWHVFVVGKTRNLLNMKLGCSDLRMVVPVVWTLCVH